VRRLLFSLLLIVFMLYFTPLDSVISVNAGEAGACRELFFTYVNKDGSIYVFKTNYNCFNYTIDNFYIYIFPNSSALRFLLQGQHRELLSEAWRGFTPGTYNIVMMDDLPEKTDLAGLLNDLLMFKNVNVFFSHREYRGEVFVEYMIDARFFAIEKLINVTRIAEQSSWNFSLFRELFKRELLASVLKAVEGEELFEKVNRIMTSHSMQVYDLRLAFSIDGVIELLTMIYVHNPAISLEDLVNIAYSVKSLSKHISRVILIEHIGGPRYTLQRRVDWQVFKEIPCGYAMGASVWLHEVIRLNYTCVMEHGYTVSEESLRRFVENVVSMLRNHEKYGEGFRKGYWILVIDEPPVITFGGPAPRDTTAEEQAPAPQNSLQTQLLDKSTVMTRILATLTTLASVLIFITLLARKST